MARTMASLIGLAGAVTNTTSAISPWTITRPVVRTPATAWLKPSAAQPQEGVAQQPSPADV